MVEKTLVFNVFHSHHSDPVKQLYPHYNGIVSNSDVNSISFRIM
jgi:hypothetical protein